jgi:hypothetical protein
VLALAAANAVGVVLFGTLYIVAGAGLLSQTVFLVCLPVLFVLVTSLWVYAEARNRDLEPLARIGNAAAGFAVVAIASPVVVLMPLFWLDTQIPREAGLNPMLAPVMAVVLIALALVAATNVFGTVVIVARRLLARRQNA